jgi:biopolymer transport protein ExbB
MIRLARLASVLLTALLVLPALSAPAAAWWNSDWSSRIKVTADAGPKGANIPAGTPIGRTQVLVRLTDQRLDFNSVKEDGSDLRVVAADDKTPLHFHIEKFDPLVDQVALIWVDVPDLAAGAATSFYIYYNNKNAAAGGDSKTTYDVDRLLDYHFAAENGLPLDYTAYANNALTPGKRDSAGLIGFALRLDGSAPVLIPASQSLSIPAGQPMTWSMWVQPTVPAASPDAPAQTAAPAAAGPSQATAVLYAIRDPQTQDALTIGLDRGVAYAQIDTPAGSSRTSPGAPISADAWHQVAVTAGDKLTVYVDGLPEGEAAAAMPAIAAQSALGGLPPAAAPAPAAGAAAPPAGAPSGQNFTGVIDEFEITKAVRPLGALLVDVRNQGPDASLLTYDVAETASALGSGYFAIIVRSVTLDAWVVIGLLGVMLVISWAVMVGKAIYLSSVSRADNVFRAEFRQVAIGPGDNRAAFLPMSTANKPALARSPLFRLYDVGARELNERLHDGRLAADGVLSPQSLAAIRSAMEAQLIRETQRLNRLMVLLTIAISGGPFVGLFGTVVGVMITFAAIAAAGDVNVNSIAPGIAAALLATAAGMAVAIPALFGYNYFLTRIRDVTTELNVFVDELVTRMAEGFRGSVPLTAASGGADVQALVNELVARLSATLRPPASQPGE